MAQNLKPIIDLNLNEILVQLHQNAVETSNKAQPDIKIMNTLVGDVKADAINENAGEHALLAEYTGKNTIAGDKLKDQCKDALAKYVQSFADQKDVKADDLNDIVTFMTDSKSITSESNVIDYTKPMLENLFVDYDYSQILDEAYSAAEESATYDKDSTLSILNVGFSLLYKVEIEGKKDKDLRSNMNACARFALFAKDTIFNGLVAGTYFIEKEALKLAYKLGKGAVKISYIAGSSALSKGYDITKGLTQASYDIVKGFSNTAYSLAKGALSKTYSLGKGALSKAYSLGKGLTKGILSPLDNIDIKFANGSHLKPMDAPNAIGRAADATARAAGRAADATTRAAGRATDATARAAGRAADATARVAGRAADATTRTVGNVADRSARIAGDVSDKAIRTTADIADKGARAVGRFAKDYKSTAFGKWLDKTFGKKDIKSIENSFNNLVTDEFGEGAKDIHVVTWPIDNTFEQQLRKTGKVNSQLIDVIEANKDKKRYCLVVYVPKNTPAYKEFNKKIIAQLFTNALRKSKHDVVIPIDPDKHVFLIKDVPNNALRTTTDESIRKDIEKQNIIGFLFEAKERSSFDDFLDDIRKKDRYKDKSDSDMYIVLVGDRKLSKDEEVA